MQRSDFLLVVSDEDIYPSREFQVPIQPRARVGTVQERSPMIRRSCVCGCIQYEITTCGHRQCQISKARQTSIGSAFVLRPRYLAVLSILAWPKSARTVCKSPVPFKMWRAFVRRKDSTL